MKVLVILAHPDEKSFNHAIAQAALEALKENKHDVIFHDLYKENFNPFITPGEIPKGSPLPAVIRRHCREIVDADAMIIIHPNWWGQPPAVLKGWIDRVFRCGVAYEFVEGDKGEGVPVKLLKTKASIVFNTSNTEAEREKNIFGDPLEPIWKNCIFGLCTNANFHRRMFGVVITSTEEKRKEWLQEVKDDINRFII